MALKHDYKKIAGDGKSISAPQPKWKGCDKCGLKFPTMHIVKNEDDEQVHEWCTNCYEKRKPKPNPDEEE